MTEGQEYLWYIELDEMRTRLRYALDNLDSIDRRTYVRHQIEQVHARLKDLAELTKGESNA